MNGSFSRARRALALVTLTALAACSGGGGSHAAIPAAPGGSGAAASGKLTSVLVPPAKFTSSATKVGPATGVSTLVMHVVVNLRDGRGLADYAAAVSNPSDGRYRQFLTASEIGDRYGAAPSDYAAVAQYFAASGLRVGGWPQRLGLTVAGPRAAFEKAFGTTFALYRSAEGHQLVAPSGPIAFSRPLPVTSVADAILDPQVKHTNFVRGGSGGPQSGSLTGNTPQQMAAAFDFTGAYAAGYTGKNITIGIIGTGPIAPQDFSAYKSQFGWTGSSALTQVNVQPAGGERRQLADRDPAAGHRALHDRQQPEPPALAVAHPDLQPGRLRGPDRHRASHAGEGRQRRVLPGLRAQRVRRPQRHAVRARLGRRKPRLRLPGPGRVRRRDPAGHRRQ